MRAHRSNARGKSDAAGRARLLIKSRLWWLDGFPDGDRWIAMPLDGSREAEPVALDRNHLRRATRTIGELQSEFPRALPRLVGNPTRWADAARRVVELVKPWVHGGPPPRLAPWESDLYPRDARERAAALVSEHPALQPLVDALAWMLATRAATATRALRWLGRNPDAIAAVLTGCSEQDREGRLARLMLAVRLVHLAVTVGEGLVAPLVDLAAAAQRRTRVRDHERIAARSAEAIQPALMRVERLPEPSPSISLADKVATWADWLATVDASVQRRFCRLVGACDLPPLVAAWAAWWSRLDELLARPRLIEAGLDRAVTPSLLERLHRAVEEHSRRTPPALHLRALGTALRGLSAEGGETCGAPALAALARVPARLGLRAALVVQWGLRCGSDDRHRRLGRFLTQLRDYLAATGGDDAALAPLAGDAFGDAARGSSGYCLGDEIEDRPPEQIKRCLAALAAVHARRPGATTRDVGLRIAELSTLAGAGELDRDRLAALGVSLFEAEEHGRWIGDDIGRAALLLCGDQPGTFGALVHALREIQDRESGLAIGSLARALAPAFTDDPAALRELFVAADRSGMIASGERLAALEAVGGVLPARGLHSGSAGWIDGYPAELHPPLRLLARSTAEAEPIARRLIDSVWRSRASLERERDAIAAQLATADGEKRRKLEKRRANLARRAEESAAPSARALGQIAEKLRKRAVLERLRALDAATGERLAPAAAGHLGIAEAPPWLLEPRVLRLLPALAELPPRDRGLARELLRLRTGEPPWDMRRHGANQSFLRRLEARGIDAGPWVDGIGTVERKGPQGPLWFSLEDDPLEVFHMGSHFQTCLAPGGINFFSVLSNAADINKRVLFARGKNGGVLGRRLLCLTDDGAMLAFHAYAHDPEVGFEALSDQLAVELAERMRTRLSNRGKVPTLVASRWYDDGPVDVTGQLAFLSDGSEFRIGLTRASAADLPALVAAALGTEAIDAHVAPMIVVLPELAGRPELVHGLLPLIRDLSQLSVAAVLSLARLLERAGSATTAASLFGEVLERDAIRQFRVNGWTSLGGIEILCRIAPGRGLRALRLTRPDRARSWTEEKHADRLVLGATALELLHRPTQAETLWRQASRSDGPESAVRAARKHLRERESAGPVRRDRRG